VWAQAGASGGRPGDRDLHSLGYINYREPIAAVRFAPRGLLEKLEMRCRVARETPFGVFRA